MSVRRKGPRAAAVRALTYFVLVAVAAIVVFPFVVAVATSTKNSQDIFNYPPTLIPREAQTVAAADVGLDGDPVPLYSFDDSDAKFALVDNNLSVAEFRPLDDIDRIVRGSPLDWGELVGAAEDCGLGPATALSLRLAQLTLGSEVPRVVLHDLFPRSLSRAHVAMLQPMALLFDSQIERPHARRPNGASKCHVVERFRSARYIPIPSTATSLSRRSSTR